MHILGGRLAEVEGAHHAEFGVEGLGGVGVDGEGAGGGGGVEGDEVRLAAADDEEGGGGRERVQSLGRDGGAEAAEVFLADLFCSEGCQSQVPPWEQGAPDYRETRGGRTYPAKEMADEDDEDAAGVGGVVEAPEGDGIAVRIEDGEVIDGAELGCGGWFLGDFDVAGEIAVRANGFGGVVAGVVFVLGRGGGPGLGTGRFGGFGHGHCLYTHACRECSKNMSWWKMVGPRYHRKAKVRSQQSEKLATRLISRRKGS